MRLVQRPQCAHTSAACGVGTAAIVGRTRRAASSLCVAFLLTTAPHGVVPDPADSNLAGNLAFGRSVLLTRADGLEVPHYFNAYIIYGGSAYAGQILCQVREGL